MEEPTIYVAWDKYLQNLCDKRGIVKSYRASPQVHKQIDLFTDDNSQASSQNAVPAAIEEENKEGQQKIPEQPATTEDKKDVENENQMEKDERIENNIPPIPQECTDRNVASRFIHQWKGQWFITKKYFARNMIVKLSHQYEQETGLAACIMVKGAETKELKKLNPQIDPRTHTMSLYTIDFLTYYHENTEDDGTLKEEEEEELEF
jgi:hypothetical protein